MQFTIATIMAICLAASATANPLLARQNGVTCQTSDASPESADITDVINQLNGQGGDCPNTNHEGSDCTTLVKHNSAAISICGEEDPIYTCSQVAGWANSIQQTCLSNGRAGGTYTISQAQRVEVIAS